MKYIVIISMMLFSLPGIGCGTRNYYDGFRMQQEMECRKLQGYDRDECVGRSGINYDEYQRQMKERNKEK